jgi:glucose uptake protein GlcU
MAVASLVCSLVGVIPCFWLFQIMGVLGTIFGFVGLKQTKNGARPGRGMAMAGVIIGIVLVIGCIIVWVWLRTHANCVRVGNSYKCTAK